MRAVSMAARAVSPISAATVAMPGSPCMVQDCLKRSPPSIADGASATGEGAPLSRSAVPAHTREEVIPMANIERRLSEMGITLPKP